MGLQEGGRDDASRVVIGIPTFNRSDRLARCIDSALAQTYEHIEVLVSDNASTDGTEDLCRAYVARDARLQYTRQSRNVGATRNFLDLFARAKAPLFMWLADDDWIDPGFVRRCVTELQARPGLVLVGARALYDGAATPTGNAVQCDGESPVGRALTYYRQVDDNAIFYGVMRRDVAARIDVMNVMGGDWLFMAAMAFHGGLRTVDGVYIHRGRGGASRDKRHLAASLGLPAWQGHVPVTVTLTLNAVTDVLRNRAYSGAAWRQRCALALLLPVWIVAFKPAQELLRRWSARRVGA